MAAGLRPDPLGELTALPRPIVGLKGKGKGGKEGRERGGEKLGRREKKRKGREGRKGKRRKGENGKGKGRIAPPPRRRAGSAYAVVIK